MKGTDADAFKTWNGKTSSSNRTFKVAKVANYKIDNGTSGGSVHLETVAASETSILQAMQELKSNDGTPLYQSKDLQGDPMNWLANTGQDSFIRKYADNPGVIGTVLEANKVSVDDANKTMTLTMTEPGLYVIFDATQPKKQTKDTGDTTVEYAGFNNMLVGTPLTAGCNVSNNTGTVDLTSSAKRQDRFHDDQSRRLPVHQGRCRKRQDRLVGCRIHRVLRQELHTGSAGRQW